MGAFGPTLKSTFQILDFLPPVLFHSAPSHFWFRCHSFLGTHCSNQQILAFLCFLGSSIIKAASHLAFLLIPLAHHNSSSRKVYPFSTHFLFHHVLLLDGIDAVDLMPSFPGFPFLSKQHPKPSFTQRFCNRDQIRCCF